jgi:hypothetical protein
MSFGVSEIAPTEGNVGVSAFRCFFPKGFVVEAARKGRFPPFRHDREMSEAERLSRRATKEPPLGRGA